MGNYILSHDLGTTGNKSTIYDREGNLIASSFYPYSTYYPYPNWVEQNPLDYWEAVKISTRELLARSKVEAGDIAVISFSGQMMGCLPVDRDGNPLRNIIIWADQRGTEEAEFIREKLGEEKVYRVTGHRISPTYSASKILWIKRNEPEIFLKTHKFLLAKDFIIYKLTGKWVTDYSDASGTNLFDLEEEKWSEEIISSLGIPGEKLPEPYSSLEIVGGLVKSSAEELDLPPGIPVVTGGGDGACAACGAGVVREGDAYNYLGASSWIAIASSKPVYDPELRTFTFHHLAPKLFMPTGTMQSAGLSYQWARDNLAIKEKEIARDLGLSPYEVMDLEAEKILPGSENLIFLPYLLGERSPYWNPDARGVFIGLTPRHTRAHLMRAIMEGVGFNLKTILEAFLSQGIEIKDIRLIGGGGKSSLWSSILANIFERDILRMEVLEEATSLGSAIAGGVGVGIFPGLNIVSRIVRVKERILPEKYIMEIYERLYPIFIETYERLLPVFRKLGG
ncbi:MAG TPA: xylulokinase [bacterium]|nr:xylulokinase [bacterium]HRR91919.1 xylulokinase [bacterium]